MAVPSWPAQRRAQVQRAAQEWRAALIDVSGNNRLLFFKPTAATLDLADAAPAAVAELLTGSSVRLARLFVDPVRLAAAQRAVKNLAAKQREAAEEYGVSVAFCAFGLATWSRNSEDALADVDAEADADTRAGELEPLRGRRELGVTEANSTASGGRKRARAAKGPTPPAAPVLLRAVELTHRPGSVDAWQLTLTGEAQLNPVLMHVLSAQGAVLDEEAVLDAGDDSRGDFAPIFEAVAKACADVRGFSIEPRSMLGAFSYLKQPMVADCEDLDALLTSDLVAALAGDEDAIAAVRTLHGDVSEADPDYKPVDTEFLVLDADASQSFVVNAALAGRNLVVQGPPGTGKSQTIGNVIAALVAEGKRVLFVAQKRAAITAVLDRLDSVGLAAVTLDLFAAGSSRRYVADQLRDVLDAQAEAGIPVTHGLHRTLTSARDLLVAHRNAIHTRQHAWGVTVAGLLAMTRKIPASAATGQRLPAATMSGWGPDGLEVQAANLGELVGKGGLAADRMTRTGWSVASLTTRQAVAVANEWLVEVASTRLPTARAALDAAAAEFGGPPPLDVSSAESFLRGLRECAALAAIAPGALDPAVSASDLENFLAATNKAYGKAAQVKLGWGARRKARKSAHALLVDANASRSDADVHALLARAKAARNGWVKRGGAGPARPLAGLTAAQDTLTLLRDGLTQLQAYVQNVALNAVPFTELEAQLASLAADRSRGQLPRLHELETALIAAGLASLLHSLRRGGMPASTVGASADSDAEAAANLLRYIAVHSALESALTTDPALAGISGDELDAAAAQFQRADDDHLAANAARVRRAAATHLKGMLDTNRTQHLLVRKEVTKKRNFLPVRTLFDQAPQVMAALKPVWAMSPLQVSRLLPAARCFDVVIFDEASQIKPADAIPALVRAARVIVAGDSRQLPPTEFFTKVLEDPPDAPEFDSEAGQLAEQAAAEQGELDAAEPVAEPRRPVGESFTRDAESILFAFDRILAGQSRQLLWHYRSRDERLIAVSNAFIYRSTLTTFPAADGADCLRYESLPPSPGIKGGTNSPAAEVSRVVEIVLEHARARPDETLGVITFGIPHTRRIEAALDAAFAAEPDLATALTGHPREPFFIKNIERVQGDERDAIILSVGYGKPVDGGRLRLFWGPLLTPGGERRLNVAISRAKSRVTLVTSFLPDDVAEDAHPSAGFALMYRFLRFMASGGIELSGDGKRPVALNAFELDMLDRLTAAGLDVVPQLGVGSYRLDFAVRHPRLPGRYVLAVEADGAAYHSGQVARERDRLRQRLLEDRGWTFHRIWSTDWFNDADAEVAATISAFEAAVAAYDEDPAGSFSKEEDADVDNHLVESSWHVAAAKRTIPRPNLRRGLAIDRYEPAKLAALVRHVRSDGVLRTRDDELTILMRELGFSKRGQRIVAALTAAQNAAG